METEAQSLPQKQTEPFVPRRIVVTGIGAITPLGLDAETSWQNLIAGNSGITKLKNPIPETEISFAGQVPNWEPKAVLGELFDIKSFRRYHRAVQFSLAATAEAVRNAGFYDEHGEFSNAIDPERVGIELGTGFGGAFTLGEVEHKFETNPRAISPSDLLLTLLERSATVPSMELNLQGPVGCTTDACATGNVSIENAVNHIFRGKADIMIAGGTEAPLNKYALELFNISGALSKAEIKKDSNSSTVSRPFDKERSGFVIAEGAGAIVFEEREHAIRRGAPILAEFVNYGHTGDAFHPTAPRPDGSGAGRAMHGALEVLYYLPYDISKGIWHINAHGTSTPEGDKHEAGAIRRVIPRKDRSRFPVSSVKGAIGHTLGAAGAIEAVFAVQTIRDGIIPGTLNLEDPIKEAEALDLVLESRHEQVDGVNSNSFGFGGINSSVVFARTPDAVGVQNNTDINTLFANGV